MNIGDTLDLSKEDAVIVLAENLQDARQGMVAMSKHYAQAQNQLWAFIRKLHPELEDFEMIYDYKNNSVTVTRKRD